MISLLSFKDKFQRTMHKKGFQNVLTNKFGNPISSHENDAIGHYIYMKDGWTVHLVEFEQMNNYLWHSALPSNLYALLPYKKDILFARNDSIFETFTSFLLNDNYKISIPSNSMSFLHQIKSSTFVKCQPILQPEEKHPDVRKVTSTIKEMKKIFEPHLMDFWLTSGTLLGWYRECDVISYTTDVDFGMWAADVSSLESLIQIIRKSNLLELETRYGLKKLTGDNFTRNIISLVIKTDMSTAKGKSVVYNQSRINHVRKSLNCSVIRIISK
ncbi:fukutin [Nephila pilipes]|uniref:Fukutin n=1 Tax=Nephila pilipes TaxID=299642 RepID=A0A8X6UME2_NEPPI|nr:fukutin [Nephila pilipes]